MGVIRKWCMFLVLSLWLFPLAGFAGENIHKTILPNGLTVLIQENHVLPIVTTAILYKVGLRNEAGEGSGKAHFVEHMLFKGTNRYPKGEIAKIINKLGGRLEAFTSLDYSAFFFDLPSRYLNIGLEIEANRMNHCNFDPEEFEAERKVIMEEKKMSLDAPHESLAEETLRQSFSRHPYRKTVLGTLENLKNLKREELVEFYRTFYQPNNAVLVVVGDIETGVALKSIRQYFDPIPKGSEPPKVGLVEPGQKRGKNFTLKRQVTFPVIEISFKAPPVDSRDSYSLQVLDSILTEGKSSRLYKKLVRDQAIFNDVSSAFYETIDPFIYSIFGELKEGTKPASAEAALFKEITLLQQQPPGEREVDKAKNQLEANFIFDLELIDEQAKRLGVAEILYGYENLQKYIQKIRSVTPEDIQKTAQKYFRDENRIVGWLLPETK